MNVLILTPDRVGSTLLQRLITVYMQAHTYDQPVINLHELTNGLMKYYSDVFNQEVLGKPNNGMPWGYYQSLPEITKLLHDTKHYKTSRLAHYHIQNRQDSLADQVPFYQYLNDNFFVISAQRKNLLEHALSWGINSHSKKLNVYTHQEKIDVFADIYQNKITVNPRLIIKYLDQYVKYLNWVNNHFSVSSYFEYETHLPNIEEYILGLDIFGGQKRISWNNMFGIEFQDWNRCHYLASDLSGLSAQLCNSAWPQIESNSTDSHSLSLQPVVTTKTIVNTLSVEDKNFIQKHVGSYIAGHRAVDELVQNKVLVTGIPIKLQTMMEKRRLIRNFEQCVETYNEWADQNNIGDLYLESDIDHLAMEEITNWHNVPRLM